MDKTFEELSLTSLPYNLGLYPILYCLFICTVHYEKMPILMAFLVFTIGITFGEFIAVLLGKLEYRNEWNIIWSGVSYLTAYLIVYLYYKLVRKFIFFS